MVYHTVSKGVMNQKVNKDPSIWIVSELYYPETTSTGYFMTLAAEALAKGFEVSVLCGQPSYSKRGLQAPTHELHNGVTIWRCRATTFDKHSLMLRAVNQLTISLSILWQAIIRIRRGDIVLVVTNPPTSLLALAGLPDAKVDLHPSH